MGKSNPSTAPEWWVDLLQWRTHSPTVQGSISLEYQTCTSPYPFDTLVTGLGQTNKFKVCLATDTTLANQRMFAIDNCDVRTGHNLFLAEPGAEEMRCGSNHLSELVHPPKKASSRSILQSLRAPNVNFVEHP